jgi:hypothetical protein
MPVHIKVSSSSNSNRSSSGFVGASAVDAIQAYLPYRPYCCHEVIEVGSVYYERCRQMKIA